MGSGSVEGRVPGLIAFYNKIAEEGKEPSKIGRSISSPPKVSADTQKTERLALERKMPNLEEKPVKWNSKLPSSQDRLGPTIGNKKMADNPDDRTKMAKQEREQKPQVIKAEKAKVEVPESYAKAEPVVFKAEPAKADVLPSHAEATPAEKFQETETKAPETARTWTKAEIPHGERRVTITPNIKAPEPIKVPEHKATITLPNPEVAAKVETTGQAVLSPARRATQIGFNEEQQKKVLNEFTKAVAKLKADPNLKLHVQKNSNGEYEISTRQREKRGFFGRFGKSEGTIATKDLLLKLGSGILASEDPKLASDYHNLLDEFLKNTDWGKEFGKKFSDVTKQISIVSDIYSPSKEGVAAIREAIKTIRNPNASLEELESASARLASSSVPGKKRVNDFYESLSLEGRERIDTLEMKDVLLAKKGETDRRDLLLSGTGWTVPSSKMAKIMDEAIKEAVKEKNISPENYSKTLSLLLDASLKLSELPQKDLGQPIDKDSLASRLYQVSILASQSEAHQKQGELLQEKIGSIDEKKIPPQTVRAEARENAIDSQTALKEIAKNPQATIKVKDPETGLETERLYRDVYIENLTKDMRAQNSALLMNIDPKEFRNLAWSKDSLKHNYAPNLSRYIANFNNTSEIIQASILSPDIVESKEEAGKLMELYIDVMDSCLKDGNYNGAMIIGSALNSSPLLRLVTTGQGTPTGLVDEKHRETLTNAEKQISSTGSYKAYRASLARGLEANKAPVPYLGTLQTDLTFISDGNPNVLSNGRTNLGKQAFMEKELNIFRQARKQLEDTSPTAERQTTFFTDFQPQVPEPAPKEGETRTTPAKFEDRAYARSLNLLPRATT